MSDNVNNDGKEPEQRNNNSGRGRGGRRGGRTGGRNIMVNTYTNTSLSDYLRDFSIMTTPERNYYMLDIRNILKMFLSYDSFIIRQPTRVAWMHAGYYAGLMCYALAGRLQRIGIETNQVYFNGNEMVSDSGIMLPAGIASVIEQYGFVEDEHGYVLIPRVTADVVLFLHQIGYDWMSNAGTIATSRVSDNLDFTSVMTAAYGVSYAVTYGWCLVSSAMQLTCPTTGCGAFDRNQLLSYLLMIDCHNAGVNITQPLLNGSFPIGNAPVPLTDTMFDRGVAPPVGGVPPWTAGMVAAIGTVRTLLGAGVGAAPFAAGFQSAALANDVLIQFQDMAYMAEITKLRVVFNCRALNKDWHGTKAPLVAVEQAGYAHPTALLVNTSAQEFYFGCILSNWVMTITPTDRYFNVENPSRRKFRYLGSPSNETVAGMRGSLIQMDILHRK